MDPLHLGSPEDTFDDLTAQLESALHTYQPRRESEDGDLGDAAVFTGSLDRYKPLSNDPQAGSGIPGLSSSGLSTAAGDTSESSTIHAPHATYGHMVSPPSYEDSIMYESATAATMAAAMAAQPSTSSLPAHADFAGPSSSPHEDIHASFDPNTMSPPSSPGPSVPSASRHSQKHALLSIEVTDPVKREQGGLFGLRASYVTYLVITHTELPGFPQPMCTCRRRFRDFVALADLLKLRYRGYFLPPRPDKNAVEGQRASGAFVEERRAALERYLNKLAAHPVVARCEELRTFLQAEGELESSPAWCALLPLGGGGGLVDGTTKLSKQLFGLERAVLDPVQATQPTKKTTDILRAIKETAQSMQVVSLPADEMELRKTREGLEGVKEALAAASRAAEKLVHKMERLGAVHGDLGLSLFKVSKVEEADGPVLAAYTGTIRQSTLICADTKRVAASLVRSSRVVRRATGAAATELSTLHELLGLLPAAVKGLSAREKQLLTADTLQADLEARQRSIKDLEVASSKVLGGDAGKAKRVGDLRTDAAKLELSIQAARAEYDKIKGINVTELNRLRTEYDEDLGHMLQSFITAQVASCQRSAEVWLQLAGDLGVEKEQLADARRGLASQHPQPAHAGPKG